MLVALKCATSRWNRTIDRQTCRDLISELATRVPITIIVDAIDLLEYTDCKHLVEDLQGIQRSSLRAFKVFLSADSGRLKYTHFVNSESVLSMDNRKDLAAFIDREITKEFENGNLDACIRNQKSDIVKLLTDKSGDMYVPNHSAYHHIVLTVLRFLWAQVSMKALHGRGFSSSPMERLSRFPPEIKKLYKHIYEELENDLTPDERGLLNRVLLFALYRNPWSGLSVAEMLDAIFGSDTKGKHEQPSKLPRPSKALDEVLHLCSGFLDTDKERISFGLSHPSIREFLNEMPKYAEGPGHLTLGNLCVRELRYFLANKDSKWKLEHFFCYAITQYQYHYL